MAHLIPTRSVLEKRAGLLHAESMGRDLAHDQAVFALAEDAGRLLKEAGIFSSIGKAVSKRLAKVPKVGRVSGRKGVAANRSAAAATPAAKTQAKQQYVQKNVNQQQAAKGPGQLSPVPSVQAPPTRAARPQQSRVGKVGAPAAKPGKATAAKAKPGQLRAGSVRGKAQGQLPAGNWQQGRVAKGGYAAPGQLQPVGGAAPGKASGKLKKAPDKTEGRAAGVRAERQAKADKLTGKKKKKGWGAGKWLGAAALGTAGLGAYGAVKAAPHVLRSLEQTSTTPMAQSGGWSSTPYGYGHTPYGRGSPTMGYGG